MTDYAVGQVLSFEARDGHPPSRIVGIDHYTTRCRDGLTRRWNSLTLVPEAPEDQGGLYARWYLVGLPDFPGRPDTVTWSFVRVIEPGSLPEGLEVVDALSGQASLPATGESHYSAESDLVTYWQPAEGQMYAKEDFSDGSTLYFKTNPLKGPAAVAA